MPASQLRTSADAEKAGLAIQETLRTNSLSATPTQIAAAMGMLPTLRGAN